MPFLVSHSLIKNFFELANLARLLLNLNETNYDQSTQAFKTTILSDKKTTETLSIIIKQLNKDFDDLKKDATAPSSDIKKLEQELNEKNLHNVSHYREMSSLPEGFTAIIIQFAKLLFRYYIIDEKIKSSNFEVRDLDEFTALVIPINYLEQKKKNIKTQFPKITAEAPDLIDEICIGLKYKKLKIIQKYTEPRSYNRNRFEDWHYTYLDNAFIKILNLLFFSVHKPLVTADQELRNIHTDYLWNIYMSGHGSKSTSAMPTIIGMNEQTFIAALNFFQSKINTNSAFVTSCYSAGKRLAILKPWQYRHKTEFCFLPLMLFLLMTNHSCKQI